MTRARNSIVTRSRHRKILKLAKGYRGRSKNCFRSAKQRVEKSMLYAYRDRKNKKRTFRSLWIQRLNAYAREQGTTYSQLMYQLKNSDITINRKLLSELAISQPIEFQILMNKI